MAKGDFNYTGLNKIIKEGKELQFPPSEFEYETVLLKLLGDDNELFLGDTAHKSGRYIYNDLNGNIYSIAMEFEYEKIVLKELKSKIILNQKFHE